jgi:hypothetical protein
LKRITKKLTQLSLRTRNPAQKSYPPNLQLFTKLIGFFFKKGKLIVKVALTLKVFATIYTYFLNNQLPTTLSLKNYLNVKELFFILNTTRRYNNCTEILA